MPAENAILKDYLLHLADNSMILGQRNAEWCGHGPVLEQDIALTNIALDLIGEARSLYQYAAELSGDGQTEDSVAFLRDVLAYKNLLLVEQPNTDWAYTICRQFFYDAFHYYVLEALAEEAKDGRLADIARKSMKEAAYHLKWSSEWMIRLGDGTAVSHEKMQNAVNGLWEFTGELFMPSETEAEAFKAGIGADLKMIATIWQNKVNDVLQEATLKKPESAYMQKGGKIGHHSEHLGYILAEMQYLQRAYPGAEW